MPFFKNAEDTEANNGEFNDVTGDQYNGGRKGTKKYVDSDNTNDTQLIGSLNNRKVNQNLRGTAGDQGRTRA